MLASDIACIVKVFSKGYILRLLLNVNIPHCPGCYEKPEVDFLGVSVVYQLKDHTLYGPPYCLQKGAYWKIKYHCSPSFVLVCILY